MAIDSKLQPSSRIEIRPLRLGRYQGVILRPYDEPALLNVLSSPESIGRRPGARVLLDSRNRLSIVRFPLSADREVDIVVKEFFPRGINRLKSLVRPSRAKRAWQGALALKERGLPTAPPVGYLEARRSRAGFVEHSLFMAEEVKSAEQIRTLFQTLRPSQLRPLLTDLASHLCLCHKLGLLHRDLSDGNILVQTAEDGKFKFYLLDTTRIRFRRRLGRLIRVKNLIRLGVPVALWDFFLAEYFRFAGWRDSQVLRAWYKINKRIFTGYVALKKKLRLRRIARQLRLQ